MGLLELLGLPSVGKATATTTATAMATATTTATAPKDDALAAARKKYEDAKLALEQGDLARLPAKAPEGVEGAFAAVAAAGGRPRCRSLDMRRTFSGVRKIYPSPDQARLPDESR